MIIHWKTRIHTLQLEAYLVIFIGVVGQGSVRTAVDETNKFPAKGQYQQK